MELSIRGIVEGKSFEKLEVMIRDRADATALVEIPPERISVYSLRASEDTRNPVWRFWKLDEVALEELNVGRPLVETRFKASVLPGWLRNEIAEVGFYLCVADENCATHTFFVSPLAMSQLMRQLGIGGTALQVPCLTRDMLIEEMLRRTGKKIRLIYRTATLPVTVNGQAKKIRIRRILGFAGQQLSVDKMEDLLAACRTLEAKGGKIAWWKADSEIVRVMYEFPDHKYDKKREITPGILLSNSDVGAASFTVQATAREKGKDYVLAGAEAKLVHRSEVTEEAAEDAAETIYNRIDDYAAAYAARAAERISPAGHPDDLARWGASNVLHVKGAIKGYLKACGLSEIIGKKRELAFDATLEKHIKPEKVYYAGDVVSLLNGLPSALAKEGVGEERLKKVRRACGSIAFMPVKGVA